MKRLIFTLLVAVASAMAVTSCTEEEVVPNTENGGTFPDVS
jgi:hypothetical protein